VHETSLSGLPRRAVAIGLLALVLGGFAWRHLTGSGGHGAALRVAPVVPAQARASAARQIVVDVVGAVRRPGVYRLAQGQRVADAVARAGGLTKRAERTAVNFAAPVADGEQVVVVARGAPGAAAAGGASTSGPVSLNSASAEQLDSLPGVGPVTAQKIIAYRQQHGPFTSLDELDAIPGIGQARIANLQGLAVP
jgi:competence protein ComEA